MYLRCILLRKKRFLFIESRNNNLEIIFYRKLKSKQIKSSNQNKKYTC